MISRFYRTLLLPAFATLLSVSAIASEQAYDYEHLDIPVLCDTQWYGCLNNIDQSNHVNQSFYTVIGTKPLGSDGLPQNDSLTYAFLTYQDSPVDGDNPMPSPGTYSFGADESSSSMVLASSAHIYKVDGNGNYEWDRAVKDGRLTISVTEAEGERYYTYDLTLVDEKDRTHHVTYTSRFIQYEDMSQSPMYLTGDIDMIPDKLITSFVGVEDGVMKVTMTFYSESPSGVANPTSNELTLNLYTEYQKNGIANGTYHVDADESREVFSILPGEIMNFAGMYYPVGSYLTHIQSNSSLHWGCFKSGNMTISGDGNERRIVAEFTTVEDFKVTFSYVGDINVMMLPDSGLQSDKVLDLENAEGIFEFYGDKYKYGGASTWIVRINPEESSHDGIQIELSTRTDHSMQGIPTGSFRMSNSDRLWPGEYAQGLAEKDEQGQITSITGSWHMATSEENPDLYMPVAPSRGGSLNVSKGNQGDYTITFDFEDGLGHNWSGTWSGTPVIKPMIEEPPFGEVHEPALSDQYVINGREIRLVETQYVTLTDMQGRIIVHGTTDLVTIHAEGIYILTVNGRHHKISIR